MRKVYFRADGDPNIGLGHVIRSCALAEMLKTTFECTFFIRTPSAYLLEEIQKSGCSVRSLEETDHYKEAIEWAKRLKGDEIIVLDGYAFDTNYQQILKKTGCPIVCIDDIHAYHFVADVIINHGTVNSRMYSAEPYSRILAGPEYCLLRQPFTAGRPIPAPANSTVFLNFGGADKYNLTTRYIKEILGDGRVKFIHVVLGNAFQYFDELKDAIIAGDEAKVELHNSLTAEGMVDIISQCELAIVPGSTVALECASLGIAMISGYYVDNQIDINSMLTALGLSLTKGDFNTSPQEINELIGKALSPDVKNGLLKMQDTFFDGRSAERLLDLFISLSQKQPA